MKTFLQLLAEDLVKKYDCRFEHLTIIFPNKRAGLFLARELAALIPQPVWMPEIMTISEFIERHSGLKKAEELPLIIKLYKAYTEASGSDEKFDDFYFWGNMLLNDFDDIDKYLSPARMIFSNLTALKEIEAGFSFLDGEQLKAIRMFWSAFHPERYSKEQVEFLKVWEKLYPTYTLFRERLLGERLCYEGMGIRYFCEHIGEFDIPNHIIFAGFNALSACEQQIFRFFRDKNQASFYWDYDIYYTANKQHEAGKFIRENLKAFPNELGMEHFNNFKRRAPRMEYISVPSAIGQAKLIPTLLREQGGEGYADTAIVLCDEQMLVPVISSIPEEADKINITMGYPAGNTPVAALVHLLGECRKYRKEQGGRMYYYYKPVIALLNHTWIRSVCPEVAGKTVEDIHKRNLLYMSGEELHHHRLLSLIFPGEEGETAAYVVRILDELLPALKEAEGVQELELESLFVLRRQLQAMENTFREEGIRPDDRLYLQIIRRVVHSLTVPFSGEPLEQLQVMGLLETRMLDFRNLIILSANEGVIPKSTQGASFIPYNLRVGFKLPTPEHQEALFAYYFYRLLQRGERIRILYSSGLRGISGSEMSRYLFQIKYESGLPVRELYFQNTISVQERVPILIRKSTEMVEELLGRYGGREHPLSPSALNAYLDCPLRFYFRYVARIKEKEEVQEELDNRLLGNIFHECSQSLYRPLASVTEEDIRRMLAGNALIDAHITEAYARIYNREVAGLIDSGSNELILGVVRKYLRKMLGYDLRFTPFRMISMEGSYSALFRVGSGKTVWLGGNIDRVDETAESIRIIDYKTGADETRVRDIATLFDPQNKTRNKAAFQTMLYCLIYHEANSGKAIMPGIYSVKRMFAREYDHLITVGGDRVTDFNDHREAFTTHLSALLEELFSPDHPFAQTNDENKCRHCPYAPICNTGKSA